MKASDGARCRTHMPASRCTSTHKTPEPGPDTGVLQVPPCLGSSSGDPLNTTTLPQFGNSLPNCSRKTSAPGTWP